MSNKQSTEQTDRAGQQNVSRIEGRTLFFERIFNAPRELVFKAFTEAERLAQWWGPHGWQTTNYTMDVRPGGIWHYCMRGPDDAESWSKAIYQEIVPPRRIVYTDTFADKDGNVLENMPQIEITIELAEHEGKTKVTMHAQLSSAGELQSLVDMGMIEGLNETWDRLAAYLEKATLSN